MKIVGVGCGPGLLTEQAILAISGARIIYGSDRAIALAAGYIPTGCNVRKLTTFQPELPFPDDAVVLSTGDPQLAGLGYLGGDIVPGISSLQIAAARLGIPLEQISVVVAHGKEHAQALGEVVTEVGRGKIVYIVTDPKFSMPALGSALAGSGKEIFIALCEDLGYPGEKILIGTVSEPPVPASRLFSVMVGRTGSPRRKNQAQ